MLIWAKILELINRQIQFGGKELDIIGILHKFIAQLYTTAEDRSSAGLLGAIGFGKRSDLPLK